MANTIEKVNGDGCLVEEATFVALFNRLCKLEGVQSKLWSGNFNEPDVHDDSQPINIDETRADAGWVKVGTNGMQFTGSPDHVEILGHHVANNNGNHWAHPHISVLRNGVAIAEGSGLHMDESATYSGRATINISFIDSAPGTDPIYTFVSLEDDLRTMDDPTIPELSPLTLKAFCTDGVVDSGDSDSGTTLGADANGALVSDNFQDGNGNAPFNLQVRNTAGNATNWQAVVTGPYTTIPNLVAGAYTLVTTDNGDGTYTHTFTGTGALGAYANITITGDAPTPAGSGGTANVGLYIP